MAPPSGEGRPARVTVVEATARREAGRTLAVTVDNSRGCGRVLELSGQRYFVADLGIIVGGEDDKSLRVEEVIANFDKSWNRIVPGLVTAWNARSVLSVEPGDKIVSVNKAGTSSGSSRQDLLRELRLKEVLEIEVACCEARETAVTSTSFFDLSSAQPIQVLNQCVVEKHGVLTELQVLSCDGKRLQGGEALLDTVIQDGKAVVHLTSLLGLNLNRTGARIQEAGLRTVSLARLRDLLAFVRAQCGSDGVVVGWNDTDDQSATVGQALRYETLTMHQLMEWVVRPASAGCDRSFAELVAPSAPTPAPSHASSSASWLVAHSWAEPFTSLVACIEHHCEMQGLPSDTAFWIDAFAHDPWKHQSVLQSDRDAVAPQSVLESAARHCGGGTLLILSERGSGHLWGVFAALATLEQCADRPVDLAAFHKTGPMILTDGLACCDGPGGSAWMRKRVREAAFPLDLVWSALSSSTVAAIEAASVDRRCLLRSLRGGGRAAEGADAETAAAWCTDKAVRLLRATLAVAAWCTAVGQGEQGPLADPLAAAMRKSADSRRVGLSFAGCQQSLRDAHLAELAGSWPENLRELDLDLYACAAVSDAGLAEVARRLPGGLETLTLNCTQCQNITNAAVLELGKHLPEGLIKLTLNFQQCPGVGDVGVVPLGDAPPKGLAKLDLNFWSCPFVGNASLLALARCVPPGLRELALTFNCMTSFIAGQSGVTNTGVIALAAALPAGLTTLELRFLYCEHVNDDAVTALARAMPTSLVHLELDLRGCPRVRAERHWSCVKGAAAVRSWRAKLLGCEPESLGAVVDVSAGTDNAAGRTDRNRQVKVIFEEDPGYSKVAQRPATVDAPGPSLQAERIIDAFQSVDPFRGGTIERHRLVSVLRMIDFGGEDIDVVLCAAGYTKEDSIISYDRLFRWLYRESGVSDGRPATATASGGS